MDSFGKAKWDPDALQSSYASSFDPKDAAAARTTAYYPTDNNSLSGAPFEGASTTRGEFKNFFAEGYRPGPRVKSSAQNEHHGAVVPDGAFSAATTTRDSFQGATVRPAMAFRPTTQTVLSAPFIGVSSVRTDYPNHGRVARTNPIDTAKKTHMTTETTAFVGQSVSRADYAGGATERSKPIRHADNLSTDPSARFEGGTTSRDAFSGARGVECPGAPLVHVNRAPTPSGHVHFIKHGGQWT